MKAYTYVVNRDHEQYAGLLSIEEQASIINSAKGSKGHNTEYLYNVTRCLRDLDIKDLELEKLTAKTLKITG